MYCDSPEFRRCCFCLPLRRGVLTFGYVSIFFSAIMVALNSILIHKGYTQGIFLPSELSLVLNLIEIVFDAVLVYGAHKKLLICLKAYYYFVATTTVAVFILQFIEIFTFNNVRMLIEAVTFTFAGLCIQLYLIILVRSLIKKLEVSGPHMYENQLQQVMTGDVKVENSVYNNTTNLPTDV